MPRVAGASLPLLSCGASGHVEQPVIERGAGQAGAVFERSGHDRPSHDRAVRRWRALMMGAWSSPPRCRAACLPFAGPCQLIAAACAFEGHCSVVGAARRANCMTVDWTALWVCPAGACALAASLLECMPYLILYLGNCSCSCRPAGRLYQHSMYDSLVGTSSSSRMRCPGPGWTAGLGGAACMAAPSAGVLLSAPVLQGQPSGMQQTARRPCGSMHLCNQTPLGRPQPALTPQQGGGASCQLLSLRCRHRRHLAMHASSSTPLSTAP